MARTLQVVENQISEKRRFPLLRKLVGHPGFGITIALLILLSVVLILVETFATLPDELRGKVLLTNDILTGIFIVELSMRWLVSRTTWSFIRQYWIDIIAVFPMLRVFRMGRILRLLRLVRIFSIGAFFHRRFALFGRVFESRIVEYGIILTFTLFAVIFGAVGFSQFEVGQNGIKDNTDAFWKALFSLFAGEYADYPGSLGGKVVFILLLMFGMGVFAMLTGTFSAVMIEKLKESAMHSTQRPDELKGHIIICGYSSKAAILVNEFALDPDFAHTDILIVSEIADLEDLKIRKVNTENISILREDFTRVEVLKRAGVDRARSAIIISEGAGQRTYPDIDARTILAALTIEKLNPRIHTSAELYHPEYADHLRMGGVEDVVIQGEFSGKLLARVAMYEGLLAFFKDLLCRESGNTLSFITPPAELVGLEFSQAMSILHHQNGVVLVGIRTPDKQLDVNPRHHKLCRDDELLIIVPVSHS